MRWYYAEDRKYYNEDYLKKFKRKEADMLICPSDADLLQGLRSGRDIDVIAPYLPPSSLRNLFVFVELPNEYGILTSQEMEYLQELPPEQRETQERKIIENKLGLKITKPNVSEDKVVGLRNVKRFVYQIENITEPKLKPKAVFLAGIPGTGKSFSAKYAASVLNRYLVEFNLTKIMESPNPAFLLHSIFSYLEKLSSQGYKFVLWIDEIEKMFASLESEEEKRLMGQLLTVLNDLNEPTGYKVDGVFFITANNITQIVDKNPEFLRKGRFDELFFLDVPNIDDAAKLYSLYRKLYGDFAYYNTYTHSQNFEKDAIFYSMEEVYAEQRGKIGSPEAGERYIYTPAEIQSICKELAKRQKDNERFLSGETNIIELIYPYAVLKKISRFFGERNITYDKMKKIHEEKLKLASRRGAKLTELDLIAILSSIEPMSITMRESLAKMYSTERYFIRAD